METSRLRFRGQVGDREVINAQTVGRVTPQGLEKGEYTEVCGGLITVRVSSDRKTLDRAEDVG